MNKPVLPLSPPSEPKIDGIISPYGEKGFPMPVFLKKKMEELFSYDFSNVLICLDDSLNEKGFKACAKGLTISIDPNEYDPWSENGQKLIAHELAHIVQYIEGRIPIGFQEILIDPKLEKEAGNWEKKVNM